MKDIPLHQLKDSTSSGVHIKRFTIGQPYNNDAVSPGAHRDDHYIFFVLEKGTASLTIDFHELFLTAGNVYYILPRQVHHRIRNEHADGWFIAVDTVLIPPDCRDIFESQLLLQQPYALNDTQLKESKTLLTLLL